MEDDGASEWNVGRRRPADSATPAAKPGKGGLDLVCCKHVTVRGCVLSALGDTMHIQRCNDVVFSGNPEAAAAIHFERHGHDILVDGNIFRGSTGKLLVHEETKITLGTSIGAQVAQPSSDAQFGNPQPAERASLWE